MKETADIDSDEFKGQNNEDMPPLSLVEGQDDPEASFEDDAESIKAMFKNPSPILEAILFSSSEPISLEKIKQIMRGSGIENFPKLVDEINDKYVEQGRVYRIEKIAKGYVMMTLPDYAPWLKKLKKQKIDTRLSQAALETLAIVAYRQPLTRAEIDAIRGVSSGPLLKSLIEKGLLRIAGQAEVVGRPLLYGTTQRFLDTFSLADLKQLPQMSEASAE